MDPFLTTKLNYKPENFWPRINQEYRDFVRKGFLLEEIKDEEYHEAGIENEPFDEEKPTFQFFNSDYVEPVHRGQKFDVISILSAHADHLVRCVCHDTDSNYNNRCEFVDVGVPESLEGKRYVLIVCAFVPAKWCEINASELTMLSILSSELSSCSDFELVLVPMMRRKGDLPGFYGADAFHHFFTAFPNRLAVPVSSKRACDIMCRQLGFTGEFSAELKAVLIDSNHEVLSIGTSVFRFGSAGYPFTYNRVSQLQKELPHLSLARLLGCDPTTTLSKFGSSEAVSIDHLSTKLVGLYLFQRGDKFRVINEVYQKCRDKDRSNGIEPQFEIVLVCIPPYSCIHPFVFQEEAHRILEELELCKSWWVFPYNNSACCRLSELFELHPRDGMIIVDPSTGLAEPYGGDILGYFGMDAYPFTKEALVQIFVEKAAKITLESLLSCETVNYVIQPDGQRMYVTDLVGKYVFLYVDRHLSSHFATELLREWYHEQKERHSESDFKFVFVQYKDSEDSCPTEVTQSGDIPWLVYPCDASHSEFLRTHESFFKGLRGDKVVTGLRPPAFLAFGNDGYIRLVDGRKHVVLYFREPELERKNKKADNESNTFLPLVNDLRSQVIQILRCDFDFLWCYE